MQKIKVLCGANEVEIDLVKGLTVGQVRKDQKDTLSIPDKADAVVNGAKVKDGYVLKAGDSLEFTKPAGKKG